jgi:hypothetical protein
MITAGHTWLIKEGPRISPNALAPAIPTKRRPGEHDWEGLHRELVGIKPCRWAYDGRTDTYTCSHLEATGKTVIGKVKGFNRYTSQEA